MSITPFPEWPKELRRKRGLLSGPRVQLARESRGIGRWYLARKLGMSASELKKTEQNWNFWLTREQEVLLRVTDYPIGFFTEGEPYELEGTTFMSGQDEQGEPWCDVDVKGGAR